MIAKEDGDPDKEATYTVYLKKGGENFI